eukprot:COSAG01_NODE_8014_length_2953_cov_14.818851_4_plen_73_part_00
MMMINPIIITRTRIPIPIHCIVGSHHDNYCTSCVLVLRVRVEITGSQKCRILGESQPFLVMFDPRDKGIAKM